MNNDLKQDIQDTQERQQRKANRFTCYISELSTKVISNTESLQKVESNLNIMIQTVSKFKHKLVMQKEIYFTHLKDINSCISIIASLDQNNKVIHSCFEEKLNKAIHDTKQIATKLSEAHNKAPALKFHDPDSIFDGIDKNFMIMMRKYRI
eukprot:14979250-Ditylum_brightwellii.AAC.1